MKKHLLFVFVLPFFALPLVGQSALQSRIAAFEELPVMRPAITGLEILDAGTGQVVAAHNNHKSLIPASTLKILTTATALERLGAQYRFETKLYISGQIDANGTLQGNLHIVGGGDPTLGSSFFPDPQAFQSAWAKELKAAGIKKIAGKITVDAGCYGENATSPKWLVEDIGNYYAPGVYGVAMFDNTYRLTILSKAGDSIPTVTYCVPTTEGYLTFTNQMGKGSKNVLRIEGLPTDFNRVLKGHVANGTDSIYLKGDIPDMPRYMEFYLRSYFARQGIEIAGETIEPNGLRPLTSTLSPPLAEIIKVANFRSVNLFADHLLKQTGYEPVKAAGSGSFSSGLDVLQRFWQSKGIDLSDCSLHDGSGLSPTNNISAATLNKVLAYMLTKSPNKKAFMQSLPTAGKEGTVAGLFKKGQTTATFLLKSGSMSGVRAYSGYIIKGEKIYCVTLLCNNFSTTIPTVTNKISVLLSDLAEMLP